MRTIVRTEFIDKAQPTKIDLQEIRVHEALVFEMQYETDVSEIGTSF